MEADSPQSPARITIVGGGSYTWGPTFLRDIFIHPKLAGSQIVLHDIDPEPLDLIYSLGEKIIRRFDLPFQLAKTVDLAEALQDARFVILTISTGGLETMRHDLEIPEKYGIYQSVGDTVGPGGLSRALRNIPVIVNIARQMESLCPNAWLLNYTNPLTTLTRAVTLTTGIKTAGLCHEFIHVRARLASLWGVKPNELQARVAGINHLPWITQLSINGYDGMPRLGEVARRALAGELTDADTSSLADHYRVKSTLFELYGAFPAAGDRHVAEFFPWFLNESTNYGESYGIRRTSISERYAWRAAARAFVENLCKIADSPDRKAELEPLMAQDSGEAAAQIIAAVITGQQYQGILNLPNHGQVDGLPGGAVVETMGVIDPLGGRGLPAGELPPPVQAILSRHVANQEMIVRAGLDGDRRLALQALLNDPLFSEGSSGNLTAAGKMLDELLAANRAYLPRFWN